MTLRRSLYSDRPMLNDGPGTGMAASGCGCGWLVSGSLDLGQ
jgi:hypothetical protein